MARIAIGGFMHETNCFVPDPTEYHHFVSSADRFGILGGEELVDKLAVSGTSMSGFLKASGNNHEISPLLWTSTAPGGLVTAAAYERIGAELLARLSDAMPVEGVYLNLHGAMVSAGHEDGEGELLRRVRGIVGEDAPIVVTLDYHANVTSKMVALADALLPYETYPHIDQNETGERAARAMTRLLVEGRPTARALRHLPFLIPLNFQCTMVEPSKGIVAAAREAMRAEIVSLGYLAGFPPSDLYDCGPSVSAHGYDQGIVDKAVDDVTQYVALKEAEFAEPMMTPDEAVREAMKIAAGAGRPVVIADTQDNPGCGGSGDTVGMLEALLRNGPKDAVFGLLTDDLAAKAAHEAGEGAEITLALGGRTDLPGVEPFFGTFKVEKLCDGNFVAPGPVAQGREAQIGPSALLSIEGVRIALGSRRMQTHDRAVFQHFGIELERQAIIVLKSTCHFRADFEPIAETVLVALAPGGYIANPAEHPYRNLRAGVRLYPLGPVFRR